MVQKLPTGRFKWMENLDKLKGNISKLANEAKKGYLLEVDISCPNNLHNLHNDLLFMCDEVKVNRIQKMVLNLYKKKYAFPISALNQALKHGLVLNKVCRANEFNQSTIYRVQHPTLNQPTNNFEKAFFKLMNNSVFRKMMETS